MTTIRNNRGMSIVTALVGASIGIIVMTGLTTMVTDVFKSQRTAQTKDAHREITMAIRQLLINPLACTATFKNKDPRLGGFTATQILDEATPANVKYETGVPYLNNLVTITGFTMKNFVQDVPTNDKIGKAELDIEVNKIGDIVGSRSLKMTIYVHAFLNAGYKITQCNALGSADSLWLISPFNSDDIFYGLGRVGIGNSRPMGQLDIATAMSGAAPNNIADDLVVQNSDDTGISILSPANKVSRLFFGNPVDAGAGRVQYDHPNNLMALYTNGSEKLRINSAGNVGIGTINPVRRLHVSINDPNGARISGLFENVASGATALNTLNVNSGTSSLGLSAVHPDYTVVPNHTNKAVMSGFNNNGLVLDAFGATSILSFETGAAHAERMRIDSSGKVGIGTTAPAQILDVNGGIKVKTGEPTAANTSAAGLSFDGDTGVFSPLDGKINFWSNNNKTMTVYGTNVGIGNDAPNTKLSVTGDAHFTGRFSVGNKAQADGIAAGAINGSIIAATPSGYSVAIGENTIDERGMGIYYGTQQRGAFFEREIPPYDRVLIMKNHWGAHLAFQTTNDTNTAVYTPMVIDASKRFVGIGQGGFGVSGVPVPNWQLDVYGDINTNTAYRIHGTVICDNVACIPPSDRRLKKDIKPLTNSLEKILKLQGVSYNWKDPKKFAPGEHIGFIAQEVEEVFPQVVKHDKVADVKSVSYQHLIAPLVEAFKVVVARLTELETAFKNLFNAVEEGFGKIAALENEKANKVDVDKLKSENEVLKKENEDIKKRLEKLEKLLQAK